MLWLKQERFSNYTNPVFAGIEAVKVNKETETIKAALAATHAGDIVSLISNHKHIAASKSSLQKV